MVISDETLDLTFRALSDRSRRAILQRLSEGDATVSELAAPFEMSVPAITRHLNVLEAAGLILRQRDGRMKRCRLRCDRLGLTEDWFGAQTARSNNSHTRRETVTASDQGQGATSAGHPFVAGTPPDRELKYNAEISP